MGMMAKRDDIPKLEEEKAEEVPEEKKPEPKKEPKISYADYHSDKVRDAAIKIVGGTKPEEACKGGVDISLAKKAAAEIVAGTYFAR